MHNSTNTATERKEESNAPASDIPPDNAPDIENQDQSTSVAISSIMSRWQREDLLKKSNMIFRSSCLVFSLISAVVMATNEHGDWKEFDRYQDFRYLVAIAVMAFLYTAAQVGRQLYQLSTGKDVLSHVASSLIDFFGDQAMAYLLISALSAAGSLTTRMREDADNIFTDASAASISMAFFAFSSIALSALVSGFRLSNQTYI